MDARASTDRSPQSVNVRPINAVGGGALGMFIALLVVLHVLRADLNPLERMMSEYAVGDYGFLMTLAFLTLAVATLAITVVVALTVPDGSRSNAGLTLVGVSAVGMVVFAVFPIGVGETVDSTSDVIHRMTAPFAFFGLAIGVFLVSRRFKGDPRWSSPYVPGILFAALMLTASVGFFVSYGADLGVEGLIQRVFILTFVAWFVSVASKIRAIDWSQTTG
jgi:hypothetical protein